MIDWRWLFVGNSISQFSLWRSTLFSTTCFFFHFNRLWFVCRCRLWTLQTQYILEAVCGAMSILVWQNGKFVCFMTNAVNNLFLFSSHTRHKCHVWNSIDSDLFSFHGISLFMLAKAIVWKTVREKVIIIIITKITNVQLFVRYLSMYIGNYVISHRTRVKISETRDLFGSIKLEIFVKIYFKWICKTRK